MEKTEIVLSTLEEKLQKFDFKYSIKFIDCELKEIKTISDYGGIGGPQNCTTIEYSYNLVVNYIYKEEYYSLDLKEITGDFLFTHYKSNIFINLIKKLIEVDCLKKDLGMI